MKILDVLYDVGLGFLEELLDPLDPRVFPSKLAEPRLDQELYRPLRQLPAGLLPLLLQLPELLERLPDGLLELFLPLEDLLLLGLGEGLVLLLGVGSAIRLQGDGIDPHWGALDGEPQASGPLLKPSKQFLTPGHKPLPFFLGLRLELFRLEHLRQFPLEEIDASVHVLLQLPALAGRKQEVPRPMGDLEVVHVTDVRRGGLLAGKLLEEMGYSRCFPQTRIPTDEHVVSVAGVLDLEA